MVGKNVENRKCERVDNVEERTLLVVTVLRGKGFPVYKEEGKFGDLIVTYNVTIPSNLTEHQKELFRQLKDSSN